MKYLSKERVKKRVKPEERISVHEYVKKKLMMGEKLHLTLIDPDKIISTKELHELASPLAEAGTDAFLIGGSVGISEHEIDGVIKALRTYGLPIILFPGNVTGISRLADAILFMSLLNSDSPYYIIEAPVLGAPLVYRYGLEPLPTAYIIVGYGGAAGFVGKARPIPYTKPDIGVAYVLAARYLGKKYIYLEAGSGAPEPIPSEFVSKASMVKGDTVLIVGGGIRTPEKAVEILKAGADAIVTGTIVEESPERAVSIVKAVKNLKSEPK